MVSSTSQTVEAIYENGVFHLVQPLKGIAEHAKVRVIVEEVCEPPRQLLADCIGILPDEDAAEILSIFEDEFERVDLSERQ